MAVNILAVGDICGRPGLDMLHSSLRRIIRDENIDFTVINGENADVTGILPRQADEIFDAGADVITLGNHTWGKMQIANYLDDNPRILRPANFAPQAPGRGWGIFEASFGPVQVINLIGRVGLPPAESPFFQIDRLLKENTVPITLIDFHAEATSEKSAMAWYLDGRASALWGTHTHVQTSDASVLPKGLGYITDLGMTGPVKSVLGILPEQSISMFLGNPPQRYVSAGGQAKIEGAVFTVSEKTGRCEGVRTIRIMGKEQ